MNVNLPEDNQSFEEEVNFDPENELFDVSRAQEDTRGKIAIFFTICFLITIVLCLFLPFVAFSVNSQLFANPVDNAKSLVTVAASVLSAPFGFIVGFYFKQNSNATQ